MSYKLVMVAFIILRDHMIIARPCQTSDCMAVRMPLVSDNLKSPLVAELDVSTMNHELKEYIDDSINITFSDKIKTVMVEDKEDIKEKFANLSKSLRLELESVKDNMIKTVIMEIESRIPDTQNLPKECKYVNYDGAGKYIVSPDNVSKFKVRCEHGGWTVIQKRYDGSIEFYREWNDYEKGFGDLNGEFWLGNKYISLLTSFGKHEMRIDLEDWDGTKKYALYKTFKVDDASTQYRLTVNGYTGTAGDGMTFHSGGSFSTRDRDNDQSSINCASHSQLLGAWWYTSCWRSSLNGKYTNKTTKADGGIKYIPWKRNWHSLRKSSMMIRETD